MEQNTPFDFWLATTIFHYGIVMHYRRQWLKWVNPLYERYV